MITLLTHPSFRRTIPLSKDVRTDLHYRMHICQIPPCLKKGNCAHLLNTWHETTLFPHVSQMKGSVNPVTRKTSNLNISVNSKPNRKYSSKFNQKISCSGLFWFSSRGNLSFTFGKDSHSSVSDVSAA